MMECPPFKCWCGSELQVFLNGAKFCLIHNDDYMTPPKPKFKEPKQHIPKYSGRSKSGNAWNDYQ